MLYLQLLVALCTILCTPFSLSARQHNERYNRFSPTAQASEESSHTSSDSWHDTTSEALSSAETDLVRSCPEDDDEDDDFSYDDDNEFESRGPLGTICSDLAHYCSYFANNMMTTRQQTRDRNSLLLFCNVMELMADLADYEVTPIRAETYACDIIRVFSSLRDAFESDEQMHEKKEAFPLMQQLLSLRTRNSHDTDLDIELDIYIHNMLRNKAAAQPFVKGLFSELNAYTQEKSHALLSVFHLDSLQLIDLTSRHATRSPHYGGMPHQSAEERHHLKQMGWLCHHASDACMDLSDALVQSPLLAQAQPLIKQMQSMLSAMSLTYDQLSCEPGTVRSHSKVELAGHFADMIHLMPQIAPRRLTRQSPGSAYIDRCSQLTTQQDKKRFVEEAFSSELDRQALLAEFFPLFENAVDCNLDAFSASLSQFTYETLNNCYWPEGVAS